MASDDEDELAALRRQRNARLGLQDVVKTQHQQQAQVVDDSRFFEPDPAHSSRAGLPVSKAPDSDEDDDAPVVVGENGVEELALDDFRTQFPLAFGEQEKATARLEEVHASTLRHAAAARKQRDSSAAANGPDALGVAAEAPQGVDGEAAEGNGADVGPPRPPSGAGAAGDSDEDEDDEEGDPYLLPITHEVSLQSHGKCVTAIAADRAGARLLTGGGDYQLQMFDFGGMKRDMRSFRKLEPMEGYPINALSFSPSGDAFLVVSGSSQPKVYDRDGHELGELPKGDMYIRDATHTKGHQYRCCGGAWHPDERYTAVTCSEDGTVRIWDCENLKQKTVLKPTLRRAGRVAINAVAYNTDGSVVAGGLMDGSVQLWDVRGKVGRSAAIAQVAVPKAQMVPRQDWSYVAGAKANLQGAHERDSAISCLRFSADNNTLLSRCGDDTLKVWDARKLKAPVAAFGDLPAAPSSQCCFSPDESLVVTGTANVPGAPSSGALVLFDKQRLELVRRVEMGSTVAALLWHERLNQIIVGTGDRHGGVTKVLYDPSYSEKGVLMAAARKPRAASELDFEAPLIIKNPHALPMYREEGQPTGGGRKRKLELDRLKAAKTKRPDPGASRPGQLGTGGRVGATGGSLLTQHILKQQGMMNVPEEEDVRAAFLRHDGIEDAEVARLTDMYKKTQPVRIYAEEEEDAEQKK